MCEHGTARYIPVTKGERRRNAKRVLSQKLNLNSLSIEMLPNQSVDSVNHGHVFKRHDRTKETCGGPATCKVCQSDLELLIRIITWTYEGT